MADAKNEHDDFVILQIAYDAVVAHSISPQIAERRALESVPQAAWVIETGDALL